MFERWNSNLIVKSHILSQKALCNRLQWFGNRLPVIIFEQKSKDVTLPMVFKFFKSYNFSNGFQVFLKVITLLMVLLTRHEESIKARP